MIGLSEAPVVAPELADRLHGLLTRPWDLYRERLERYEVYLNGPRIEMVRGPIRLEGAGLRVFRATSDGLGSGLSATCDFSDAGMRAMIDAATKTAAFSRVPAPAVSLPAPSVATRSPPETVDRRVWESPRESIVDHARTLAAQFDGRRDGALSFAVLHATRAESWLTNSEGVEIGSRRTLVYQEAAVTATGGPEGAPRGEYWTEQFTGRMEREGIASQVDTWISRAHDVRRAQPPPNGPTTVGLSPGALATFLPAVLAYRLSGAAEIRKLAPKPGELVASPIVSIDDDGTFPYGLGTSAFDDEGVPQRRHTLIRRGLAAELVQDAVSAGALGTALTGSAHRYSVLSVDAVPWVRFTLVPTAGVSTLAIEPGTAGTDAEIAEGIGEGLWVDQVGFAAPEPQSGSFGCEIRLGYRIRNGRLAEPVRGGTIGGIVIGGGGAESVLRSVTAVGSRPALADYLYAPPLTVEGMQVGGG